MRTVKSRLWAAFFAAACASLAHAEIAPGSGVEVANAKKLEYVVEEVNEDGRKLGLSKGQIRRRVEERLRAAGITPVDGESSGTIAPFMYVRVAVGGKGFNVRVEFSRPVLYEVNGRLLRTYGVMWSDSVTGYGPDAEFLLTAVDRPVGRFIGEFLKVNN